MRRLGSVLLAALLTLAGCRSSEDYLKPPPHPDDYTTPPVEDGRYSQPPNYPKNTLFTDPGRKPTEFGPNGPVGPKSSGTGTPRLSGPGGGY
jgi:hypothetical protein